MSVFQLDETLAFQFLTFILPDILQREGQAGVFAFDYSNLAKSAFTYHSKEAEVVQIHCPVQVNIVPMPRMMVQRGMIP